MRRLGLQIGTVAAALAACAAAHAQPVILACTGTGPTSTGALKAVNFEIMFDEDLSLIFIDGAPAQTPVFSDTKIRFWFGVLDRFTLDRATGVFTSRTRTGVCRQVDRPQRQF